MPISGPGLLFFLRKPASASLCCRAPTSATPDGTLVRVQSADKCFPGRPGTRARDTLCHTFVQRLVTPDLPTSQRIASVASDGSVGEALRGRGLIQLGLLILIATPVARVAFSFFAFLYQRDWLYVVVTLMVLGLLLYSLLGGHA